MYDYVIYGAGPTGLTLAYHLSKNNKVLLIEKENKIGGCWKVEWEQDKYFTEHSPRVIVDTLFKCNPFFKLLKMINYDYKKDLRNTYGNIFQTNMKLLSFFLKNLTFMDKLKLLILLLSKKIYKLTVTEYCDILKISNKGRRCLTIFSLLLANTPDKLLMSELYGSSGIPMFYQFSDNEKWLNIMEQTLINQNVTIMKNTTVTKLNVNNNKIISSEIISNDNKTIEGNKHILCLPPIAFYNLLKNSNILDNWRNNMDEWVELSHYYSFGFQFHFKYKIDNELINKWCWSCFNDYNLIMLPTSKYATKYSYDDTIKTVWSMTIVDTTKYINSVNKTVNDMTKDEIVDDIINKMINMGLNMDKDNMVITFYDGVEKINGKWTSKDSAFSVGKTGCINVKGTIDNLYTVGPHNKKGITTINKAVECANDFLNIII